MLPSTAEPRGRLRVGRYLVTGRIGRGGMGAVYRALDETLEREVALKTLIAEGAFDEAGRKRFEVEAKAAARLQHPNIVTVFELGEDRGIPFIAMELLPGADLEAVLRGTEPLSLAEKLDVVAQACRGLAFAHEHGIVHRDVKPSNIRLLDDGAVKIMDFGIAKLGGTQLTRAGMMVGTVNYMSPEQVRGKPLDGRSDVFSLGVILYEMLAGQRPFQGEGTTQVLYKIVHDSPPPLDLAPLGEIAPRLAAIVERALAKDRDERYPNAGAMADEVAAALEEVQRAAGTPPPEAQAALAEARQLLRQGAPEEALPSLQALVAWHPGHVEARRALRAAARETARHGQPAPASSDEYKELEPTFRPPSTKQESRTGVAPTVEAEPLRMRRKDAAPVTAVARRVRRGWLLLALAVLGVLLVAGAVLVRGIRRAPVGPVRLAVRSQPPGALVLVDGRDTGVTTDGELVLAPPVPERVTLTFRKPGHREESRRLLTSAQGAAPVSVRLQSLVPLLSVQTRPKGAAVTLDGERVGTTPTEIALDPAAEHRLSLSLDGYQAHELRLAKGERPAPLEVALQPLPPPGTVTVLASYPVEVLWHGRTLGRGQTAVRVSLPGGRQQLTLIAPSVFLRADVSVDVRSGGSTGLEAPRLGRLNVRANPDNCQVFVDGTFVDYPPILDRPLASGRHVVSFKWPDGARSQQTVEVQAGSPAFATGQKE